MIEPIQIGIWAGGLFPTWNVLSRYPMWKRLLITITWPAWLAWILFYSWVRI